MIKKLSFFYGDNEFENNMSNHEIKVKSKFIIKIIEVFLENRTVSKLEFQNSHFFQKPISLVRIIIYCALFF